MEALSLVVSFWFCEGEGVGGWEKEGSGVGCVVLHMRERQRERERKRRKEGHNGYFEKHVHIKGGEYWLKIYI